MAAVDAPARVCYFTNVYPAPSHTTMRREIQALEALGALVVRAAARRFAGPLVELADREEAARTAYTAESVAHALACLLWVACTRPLGLARALRDVVTVGRRTRAGLWKHLMYAGQACVLLRLARGCSHVHANFSNATGIATLCRVLGGPPVSLRIHGPEEFDLFTPAEWDWKLRHAAFAAPISDYGERRLRGLAASAHHRKIEALRCGVDRGALAQGGAGAAPLPAAHRLLCVARLEERKGHAVLLEALAALHAQGLNASLVLIGDGSLRERLQRQAAALGVAGSVEFAGWRDGTQVLRAIEQARVVVLPSHAEGLPIVIMEAFALGRAVVSTRVAGIPELVIPGRTGWLVEPGDAASLAAALKAALLSPDEALAAMGRAAQTLVRDHHAADRLMRELLRRCDNDGEGSPWTS